MAFPTDTEPEYDDDEAMTLHKLLAVLNEANGGPTEDMAFPTDTIPKFKDGPSLTLKKLLKAAKGFFDGAGGGYATLNGVETLTNKTLTSPTLTTPTIIGTATVRASSDGASTLAVLLADGTFAFSAGTLPAFPSVSAIWVGPGARTNENYTIFKAAGITVLQDDTQIRFSIGAGVETFSITGAKTIINGKLTAWASGGLGVGSNFTGTDPGNGRLLVAFGGSTSAARVGGVTTTDTTQTGNAGTGEDTLQTYSVPAASLATNGDSFCFSVAGTITNNANAKRIRVKFGAATIFDTGASGIAAVTAMDWRITGEVIRTGATTQKCSVSAVFGAVLVSIPSVDYTTAAETLSGAVTFLVTGEATTDNDIVKELFKASWNPG